MRFSDVIIHPSKDMEDNSMKIFELAKDSSKNGIPVSEFLNLVNQGQFKDIIIHEFLEKCDIEFYSLPPEPRNPELEKRIAKLKDEQANAEYRSMTKNLTPSSPRNNDSLRQDIQSVSSQMAVIFNFVFAVIGSFFFAFKAVEYALPAPNIPAQVMMGIVTATVVALADLFFLVRTI